MNNKKRFTKINEREQKKMASATKTKEKNTKKEKIANK
jgi:hypothetical protein